MKTTYCKASEFVSAHNCLKSILAAAVAIWSIPNMRRVSRHVGDFCGKNGNIKFDIFLILTSKDVALGFLCTIKKHFF